MFPTITVTFAGLNRNGAIWEAQLINRPRIQDLAKPIATGAEAYSGKYHPMTVSVQNMTAMDLSLSNMIQTLGLQSMHKISCIESSF